jgi:hypothetical protein
LLQGWNRIRCMTLPASRNARSEHHGLSADCLPKRFATCCTRPKDLRKRQAHSSIGERRRRGLSKPPVGPHGAWRRSARAGFFLSVTCTEDVPYLSKDADACCGGTFGGNYRLDSAAPACKEWTRGAFRRSSSTDENRALPDAAILPRARSGHAALRRRRKWCATCRRPARGSSQQRPLRSAMPSDASARYRPVLDLGRRPKGLDVSCAATNPLPPFLLSGKANEATSCRTSSTAFACC